MTSTSPLRRILAATLAALVAAAALPGGGALLDPNPAHAEPSPEDLFQEGVRFFRDGRYNQAMALFRKVFERDPNPFVLFNIGRCYEELGELEDAEKYYQRSVGLEGLPREAKVDALQRLERLQSQLKRRAEERRVRGEALMRIDRGVFAARAAADRSPVTSTPTPQPAASNGPGWGTWTGIGLITLGIAGLGVGGVFYSDVEDNLDRQRDLSTVYIEDGNEAIRTMNPAKARNAQQAGAEVNALADTIEDDQLLSAAFFTAGGVLLLGGVTLIAIDLLSEDTPRPADAPPAASWRLNLAPGSVMLQGEF